MNDTKENVKKVEKQKKSRKLTREERLANALKKNMKLRKEKNS